MRPLSRVSCQVSRLLLALFAFLSGALVVLAAPPDLTAGGVPGDPVTISLGPTGLRGWVYHVKTNTTESRQIQVQVVDVSSPADGVLAVGDVILGADGTGANPLNFTADARKSLANAINDAEARDPATLKLLRWQAGVISTVTLTLQTMGAYSATAPYNCPKSAEILEKGLQYIMTVETAGRYSFGTLSLLAGNDLANPNNAARQARAQGEALALIPSAATMAELISDERDATSMITWQRGHTLIVLAEYYLVTGDNQVLPAIEAYAVNIAKNQSIFGTVGHIFAEKNPDGSANGPMGGVYGPVNSTGMPCFLGLLLARECGLTNPELDPAIERTSRFFAYYTGKGAAPYGEHEAFWQAHENNGKSGLSALAFALQDNRVEEEKFFAKMSTASTSERDSGHTGPFFNYLWAPLGAACGGEDAAAAHFSRIRWILDLARRWDGAFDYDTLNGDGPDSGSPYNDFRMSTAALLVYALPLRQLHLTGRGHDPARWLSSADVAAAGFSDEYDAPSRTTNELVTDLGNWSPKIQRLSANELAKRTSETTALLPTLNSLANNPNGSSRVGACFALGKINNAASAPVLAALLTDPQNHVRYAAAEGLRYLSTSAKLGVLNTILAAASSTASPLLPYNEEDPLHFAHARLGMLLFYSGNAYGPKGVIYGNGINSNAVDRNFLYPAIRAVAANPIGQARGTLTDTYRKLTPADVLALADTLVDSVHFRAPADKMFGAGIRQGGIEILQANGIAEGVPLSVVFNENDGRGSITSDILGVLQDYAGRSTTVVPDPDVIGFLKSLLGGSNAAEAQAVLDAITADPSPLALVPFKSIQSVTPDSPTLTLPSKHTILRVSSTDLAKGGSVYTWRKIHGAGYVSFFPNGTADSANTTVLFDGTPGQYLFEVKMSDSRGFTEVRETVTVTLHDSSGGLPPNIPPTANPQTVTVGRATTTPVTLTATDPEGYALAYSVTSQPTHGTLTGTLPYLRYTSDFTYTGPDAFTFEVVDSDGQASSATIDITVDTVSGFGVAVYEPFDYPTGGLNGKSGSTEVGFDGAWTANASANVFAASLSYGSLPTAGNSIGGLNGGSNNFGGKRAVKVSALAANGLLADGATLWFSVEVGYGVQDLGVPPKLANLTNARLAFALANSNFSTGNNQYYLVNEGSQLGSGLGLTLGRFNGVNGKVVATQFRDSSFGTSGSSGNFFGTEPPAGLYTGAGQSGLIVGKITWGAASDTIELYRPDTDMALPSSPISTLTVNVNQSTFDTITWARGDIVIMDEIRFGATYNSVLLGSQEMTADITPPLPGSMGFASAPAPSGPSSITMVAATAYDPLDVEYRFICVSGGGHDSGWQSDTTYTVTGLTPGVEYGYTVTARDKSPAQNQTSPSAVVSATIPTQTTVPDVIGMSQTTAGSVITASSLTVGTVSSVYHSTVPVGKVVSQTPVGETTSALGVAVDLAVSIGPDTVFDHANADIPVSGELTGSHADVQVSDDVYQFITEIESGGNPGERYSHLEHKWSFDVTGGSSVKFQVEAHHTANSEGDDFIFAYSTTGVDGIYQEMVTVTKTADDNTPQSFVLPSGTSGTVHVRVVDANRDPGKEVLDTIYIDEIAIVSQISPSVPDPMVWALSYENAGLSVLGDDFDGDGLSNGEERIWGLDPTNASSFKPIGNPLDPTAHTFSYTRRDPALTGIGYTIWYSANLEEWLEDTGAQQEPGTPDAKHVETVEVTLSPALPGDVKLFVRVRASE
jgi:hypothetical protein